MQSAVGGRGLQEKENWLIKKVEAEGSLGVRSTTCKGPGTVASRGSGNESSWDSPGL